MAYYYHFSKSCLDTDLRSAHADSTELFGRNPLFSALPIPGDMSPRGNSDSGLKIESQFLISLFFDVISLQHLRFFQEKSVFDKTSCI